MDSGSRLNKDTEHRVKQRRRTNKNKISKSRNSKRRPISKDSSISHMEKDTQKARKYMKDALHFGIEAGYLIPSQSTCKILRVSSDLIKTDSRRSKSVCDTALSKNRNIPTKLEYPEVQEQKPKQRRRRRRRQARRSRSGSRMRRRSRSRSRSRRRSRNSRSRSRARVRSSSPQNPEEVTENKADDYEIDENDPKSNIHTGDIERERKTVQSNQPDDEGSVKNVEDDGSDFSNDEDEIDDEDNKNKNDNIKS
ncbi:hypothetical protein PUN28_002504 [Cardiocondyla obscurior]